MKKYKFCKTFENTNAGSVLLLLLIIFMSSCNDYDLPETVNITPPVANGQSLSNISKQKLYELTYHHTNK